MEVVWKFKFFCLKSKPVYKCNDVFVLQTVFCQVFFKFKLVTQCLTYLNIVPAKNSILSSTLSSWKCYTLHPNKTIDNCRFKNKYRITSVLKVETYIITSISVSPIGRAVIMSVDTFKTDVIVFIGNDIMCLTDSFQHASYELTCGSQTV